MSRGALKDLIDVVDERELDTIYRVLIRFVEESPILPDEIEAVAAARRDRENGEIYSHDEVWS